MVAWITASKGVSKQLLWVAQLAFIVPYYYRALVGFLHSGAAELCKPWHRIPWVPSCSPRGQEVLILLRIFLHVHPWVRTQPGHTNTEGEQGQVRAQLSVYPCTRCPVQTGVDFCVGQPADKCKWSAGG